MKNEKSPVEWRWTDLPHVKINNDCILKHENLPDDDVIVNFLKLLGGSTMSLIHSLVLTMFKGKGVSFLGWFPNIICDNTMILILPLSSQYEIVTLNSLELT